MQGIRTPVDTHRPLSHNGRFLHQSETANFRNGLSVPNEDKEMATGARKELALLSRRVGRSCRLGAGG